MQKPEQLKIPSYGPAKTYVTLNGAALLHKI